MKSALRTTWSSTAAEQANAADREAAGLSS